jgi:hypothetical protein
MHWATGVSMAVKDRDLGLAAMNGPSGGFARENTMSSKELSRPSLMMEQPL